MKGYYKVNKLDFLKRKVSFYAFLGVVASLVLISVFYFLFDRAEEPLVNINNIEDQLKKAQAGQESEIQKLHEEALDVLHEEHPDQAHRELTEEERQNIMEEQEKELQALRDLHN